MTYHPLTLKKLPEYGLSRHEMKALDVSPIHKIPIEGTKGIGIYGSTGTGKTWAMVQIAAKKLDRAVLDMKERERAYYAEQESLCGADKSRFEHRHFSLSRELMLWVNWPEQANLIKRNPLEQSGWIESAKKTELLYLDDLGGEIMKGAEDYAFGILTEILDYRYRNDEKLCWSSNLDPNGLNRLYGARLASRLLSAWKPYKVNGADYRLKHELLPAAVAS